VEQFEYTYDATSTITTGKLIDELNRLGAEGWDVIGFASSDKTIGLNALTAILRRRLIAPPPPSDTAAAWHPDPCGRFDKRYWSGTEWTAHVGREADKKVLIDPPSLRTQPTQTANQ